MSNEIIIGNLDVHFPKLEIAELNPSDDSEVRFHLFRKLPVELQDLIWEAALPSEIINSDVDPRERHQTPSSGMPAIASACKGSREVALRYGVWLTTPLSMKPMFFIPDRSVLHCSQGIELTITANQAMHGLNSILMRMSIHFNALNRLDRIIILASDGEPGRIPATWHKTFDKRVLARVETCDLYPSDLEPGEPTRHRTYSEEAYYPRVEWTTKRWEEIETAARRAWLLAAWHVQDPVDIREEDILDSSKWFSRRVHWITRELRFMPKLVAGYMRNSV
ncbi:hypothetical protein F5Y09DRAFT_118697 [Xylaria sp. FL1042]|nr:hypothetical protein F5Y09DRAFT_118697 [Xylaria sp. FL1042]